MAAESTALRESAEQAHRIWQVADRCRHEAADLRNRAKQLDKEAQRLSSLAVAIQNGLPIEGALLRDDDEGEK